jgi:RNA polymerase sigma factor (sigma-70 family)
MKFENFYHNTFKGLFRFLYYKGLSKDEAEDLAQESYVRFLTNYGSLLNDAGYDEERFTKLLYGIAKNVWRDYIEKRISEKEKVVDLEDAGDIYGQLDEEIEKYSKPEISSQIHTQIKEVSAAIEELKPTVKRVLKLKYLQNFTRKEIALKLNISEEAVHTYQKRGVRYLKDKLNCAPNHD